MKLLFPDQEDSILWLKNNTSSVQQILEKWKETTQSRLQMLKTDTEIHKYFDDFAALKCSDGYRLVILWCTYLIKNLRICCMIRFLHSIGFLFRFKLIQCIFSFPQLEADFINMYPNANLQLYAELPILENFVINKVPVKEKTDINECSTSGKYKR